MKMKFTLMSDLHLEMCPLKIPGSDADILLLAGDIGVARLLSANLTDKHSRKSRDNFVDFFAEEVSKYPKAYYIMGNHEHYHGTWENTAEELREWVQRRAPNVTFLDKETVKLSDTLMLWGGTLWTDFRHNDPIICNAARMGMNDYNLITLTPTTCSTGMYQTTTRRKLQPETVLAEHYAARKHLFDSVDESPEKDWLIMSHHGPSWKSIDQRYGANNMLNYCYVTDLDDEIEARPQIKTWVHGHTHASQTYMIGDHCRVIVNPRGYASHNGKNENENFSPALVFEV